MGIEHRRLKRIPFNQQVLVNNSIMVNAIDISEGGLYVHTGRMFPSGEILDISFRIGNRTVNFKTRVQHCQWGVGMGLEFVDLSREQQVELKNILTELETKAAVSEKKRILIIDDNDSARVMNKSKLVLDGFTVLEAKSSMEGIKILQTEQLDLAILDLYMEHTNGLKLISLIRQMPQCKDIPIIVLSAQSTQEIITQARDAGANVFLSKMTTSPAKLSENVKTLLKR